MKTRKVLKLGGGEENAAIVEEQIEHPKEESKSRMLQVLSMVSQLGFAISLPIAGGAFVGQLLDGKFETAPRITLSLIFIGVFIAGANIYLIVKEVREK